jgi:hypothetical protein
MEASTKIREIIIYDILMKKMIDIPNNYLSNYKIIMCHIKNKVPNNIIKNITIKSHTRDNKVLNKIQQSSYNKVLNKVTQ